MEENIINDFVKRLMVLNDGLMEIDKQVTKLMRAAKLFNQYHLVSELDSIGIDIRYKRMELYNIAEDLQELKNKEE